GKLSIIFLFAVNLGVASAGLGITRRVVKVFGCRSQPRCIRSRNCVRGLKARIKFFLSTWPGELLKPISDLRFWLDLFPDLFALAAHQTLFPISKPLGDHR